MCGKGSSGSGSESDGRGGQGARHDSECHKRDDDNWTGKTCGLDPAVDDAAGDLELARHLRVGMEADVVARVDLEEERVAGVDLVAVEDHLLTEGGRAGEGAR